MNIKRLLCSLLVSVIMLTNFNINNLAYVKAQEEQITYTDISLTNQLNELYNQIGLQLNIDSKYVKILHILAGGKAVYADKQPNIYVEETVKTEAAPFEIPKCTTEYKEFNIIKCDDTSIIRPSKYHLPDAAYSVTSDIVKIMNERLEYDRQDAQIYFDSLTKESKTEVLFYEAVMQYMNQPIEVINSFYRIYEKLLFDKEYEENVLEINNGILKFKNKFNQTFIENGIADEYVLNALSIIASFDSKLALNENSDSIKERMILPYKPNYTSRENMMLAALSLVGKVRYVWGGGHSGASSIDGINPLWIQFEQLYGETETTLVPDENSKKLIEEYINNLENNENIENENIESEVSLSDLDITYIETDNPGYNKCIKPSGSWCPIHGSSSTDCSFQSPYVSDIDEYLDIMENYINIKSIDKEKYKDLMSSVSFSSINRINDSQNKNSGISVDTLNGLDCSGYCSWVYNQVTNIYNINYTANYFADSTGVMEIPFGSKLYPGDVFAWKTHIVLVVGRTSDSNLVYITSESTPNVVRFGVIYYQGASRVEIEGAKEIARQANELIGGLGENEPPHVYCMNTAGLYQEYTDSEGNIITEEEFNALQDLYNYNENNNSDSNLDLEENIVDSIEEIKESDSEETKDSNSEEILINEIPMAIDITAGEINTYNYCKIGRLKDRFIDEETVIVEYNKQFKDMYADEIIQYLLTKLDYNYVTGYNKYNGDIFNKELVAYNLIYN